jgi:selenocysteine-specific elongation factor
MIVTLAGHVDHGKTSLVKALTGVDTDRLADEKARGLTIDLGFAYIDGGSIGFVDVPGHHRFIHNMVAGVARHQHALLVIAADDGPMPQSREHLDILAMVGVRSGAIAITKCDQVDAERIEQCRSEIAGLVEGTFLQTAPVFCTTTADPDSFKPLLSHLRDRADTLIEDERELPFRMAIDRAFVIRGAGVVVTGTVHSGTVSVDDTLTHFPSGNSIRVRSVRAQDQACTTAQTGERCALNVTGIDLDEVTRGDWLTGVTPRANRCLSVNLTTLRHFPRAVKHWTPVHVYHATTHATGRIALLEPGSVAPGNEAIVDLVLDSPLIANHGDHLVVRDQSLDVTLGGAQVVYGSPGQPDRRRSEQRRARISAYANHDWQACVASLIQSGTVDITDVSDNWLVEPAAIRAELAEAGARVLDQVAVSSENWQRYTQLVLESVADSANGIRENQLPAAIPVAYRQILLNELVQAEEIAHTGGVYTLPQSEVQIPDALRDLWATLQEELAHDQSPSTGDLAKSLRQPQMMLEVKMRELVKLGLLIEIANHRFYLPDQLQSIATKVKELAHGSSFTVRQFRDATGIGRNVAIEILEHFDRRGFTRRDDNERSVLRDEL